MKHFMVDIETCGLDPSYDDVLQIGILEVNEVGDYYEPGHAFCRTLHTSQKPSEFIANMHRDLLPICNRTPMAYPSAIRAEILQFFKTCGAGNDKPVSLMGQNLMSLDVPFLLAKALLMKHDFHYRVFELMPIARVASKLLREDVATVYKMAAEACPEIQPTGKPHEALYDCYTQLRTLNGIIRLIRRTQSQAV